ncbi:23S rRNA synthase [Delftia acidovorans CCUG 274B]|uniref:pseudouridine synthase n=1 Tax=Delftia acidovorans TaxID=80866 RepID=UPI000352FBCA|nr:pseudouridine synthase [Delftia acidovorans]EPD41948.1 23S rRNA synthase [Delftia acidovorans CCUG 274B]
MNALVRNTVFYIFNAMGCYFLIGRMANFRGELIHPDPSFIGDSYEYAYRDGYSEWDGPGGQVHCHGRESGSHNGCAVLRAGASLRDRAGVPAGRGSAGPIAERNARIGRRALPLQAVPRDNGGLMSSPTSSKPSRPGADEAAAPSARPVLRRPEKPQAEPAGDARRPSGGAGRSAGARGPRNDRNERGGRNERYERSDRRDAGPRGDARDAAPRGDARDQRPRSSGFGRAEDLDRSQPRGDWRGQGGGENRAPREQRDPRDARDTRHAGDMRDSRPPRPPRPDDRRDRPYGQRDERPRDGQRDGPREGGFRDRPRDDARGPRRDDARGPRRDAPAQAEPAYRPLSGIRTYRPADGGASREIPVKRAPAPVQEQVPGAVRINKRLADMGLCSRREADEWVDKGWVRVNGELAVMGQNVVAADRITVEREARDRQDQQVTILIHKPMGYVSGQAEDGHEPAVVLVTPQNHWNQDTSRTRFNFAQLKGLAPCGRLDIDSVGLLVMTQDGRVARQIIGEDSEMDKEYLVRVTYGDRDIDVQSVFPAEQLARLCHGLSLDGEELKPAKVDWQNPEQLRFVLTEGKKRQIRRMCELVGLRVVGLKRIRIGRVTLGNLPVGQWRYLGAHEGF